MTATSLAMQVQTVPTRAPLASQQHNANTIHSVLMPNVFWFVIKIILIKKKKSKVGLVRAPKLLGNTHVFHLDTTTCELTACRGGALLELAQKAWSKEESYSDITSA